MTHDALAVETATRLNLSLDDLRGALLGRGEFNINRVSVANGGLDDTALATLRAWASVTSPDDPPPANDAGATRLRAVVTHGGIRSDGVLYTPGDTIEGSAVDVRSWEAGGLVRILSPAPGGVDPLPAGAASRPSSVARHPTAQACGLRQQRRPVLTTPPPSRALAKVSSLDRASRGGVTPRYPCCATAARGVSGERHGAPRGHHEPDDGGHKRRRPPTHA
jgi:hypothetical protein